MEAVQEVVWVQRIDDEFPLSSTLHLLCSNSLIGHSTRSGLASWSGSSSPPLFKLLVRRSLLFARLGNSAHQGHQCSSADGKQPDKLPGMSRAGSAS